MRSSKFAFGLLATLLPTTLSQSTPAPIVTGNPAGAQYIATLPTNASLPNGTFVLTTASDGNGVYVQVNVANLPPSGGPFLYHIHLNPIDSSGNCSTAGSHLDPYNVTEAFVCDPANPQMCQVGDMSGKHGGIANGTNYTVGYVDQYLSTQPGTPAFFGNRSIVVHFANKTILTCANFTISSQSSSGAGGSGSGNGNGRAGSTVVIPGAMTVTGSAGAPPSGAAGGSTAVTGMGSGTAPGAPGGTNTVVVPGGQGPVAVTTTIIAGGSTVTVTLTPTGSPQTGIPVPVAPAGSSTLVVPGGQGPVAITSTIVVSGSTVTITVGPTGSVPVGTSAPVAPMGSNTAVLPAGQAPAVSITTIIAGGSTVTVTLVPTGTPPPGTPGVVPNYTPGLNPTAPPTVTVAILVISAPSGTSVLATVNTPILQTVAGTTTFANPATSTLPSGVSAVTSMITILIGPGGNVPPPSSLTATLTNLVPPSGTVLSVTPVVITTSGNSVITTTIIGLAISVLSTTLTNLLPPSVTVLSVTPVAITTLTTTIGNSVLTTTVTGLAVPVLSTTLTNLLPPSGTVLSVTPVAITTLTSTLGNSLLTTILTGLGLPIPITSTLTTPLFTPTATLAVLAIPGTTLTQISTGAAPVQKTLTSTLVSTSTGYLTTLATFRATVPASTWTTKMPPSTVTSLGLIGKVTSLIFGKTTKVTSFLQKPTTVALLGITSKFTKTLPLPKPGKTILSILKPKPLPLGPKPKTAKTTFKITKTIIKPKGTSTCDEAAAEAQAGAQAQDAGAA
ncbi:Cell surface superoxide dismutase [Cu-Zn] 4 [Friedmanniomyces endolithicus]|uniref:superoxide dismutase n=1 Tax=Friedmanniomyces endolithicus TaxID=329885 RepID=A0AAN6H9J7_9PEZI|nr:Cell surface superoxide dismutase [Cu-Zn] 4 [Friedmanniomyces endolithicus]KAK0960898.1 Cell surface superoxide dismutase [Cu-Zn] 4 [Friedmanniomyces endolithicus]